ncbi:MAG: acyl carrier protein [Acidobacteria bacterium]|jgi:acyl carrier protein|nr:acyl carrier protein [Acidobacteriota bacterium]
MSRADYAEIFEEVKTLLGRFGKSLENIDEEADIINDLGLDSLLVMELVQEVEDAFDISFPLNDLSGIRTVKDFVLQIQKNIEV